jgi:alkylated DNA repair dioxygenase AlkB
MASGLLFDTEALEPLDLPGGEIRYAPTLDLGASPARLFSALRSELDWREETIFIFGREVRQPRLLAWYGDPEARYRYSGRLHHPLPWTARLLELKQIVEGFAGAPFNSVLANLYRDGNDSMGLHADDEPELGERPVIASLSLGEERTFRLRHRRDRRIASRQLTLASGSLLVMAGDTQRNWKHEVPKSRRALGPRINLTFRQVQPAR